MARRKRGAALFDVIHHDARFGGPPPGEGAGGLRAWFGRRRDRSGDAPAAPMSIVEPATPVTSGPSRGARLLRYLHAKIPAAPRFGLTLDEERGLVRFQLSYTAAMITLAGVIVLALMGYVIGRHGARQAMPALAAQTTDELRAGPAHPEVLDIGPTADGNDSDGPSSTPRATPAADKQTAQVNTTAGGATHGAASPFPGAPTTMPPNLDANRTVGLNYVIVQSYPPAEKQLAEDARNLLNSKGVLVTIETNIPFAPHWMSVVGVTGFARVKDSAQYDAYVERIEQIGEQFGKTSRFKRFEPRPFKWRGVKESRTAPASGNG